MDSSTTSFISFPAITNEEFNLFHSIDRNLYSLLILNLSRDPAESMQVMALWLWLERAGHDHHLIQKTLALPLTLVNVVADESVTCLKCIENDEFHFGLDENDIPTLQNLVEKGISLWYLHENRLGVLRGVTKIVNEVCARAFEDILRWVLENNIGKRTISDHDGRSSSFENNGEQGILVHGGNYFRPVINVPFNNNPHLGIFSHMGFGGTVSVPLILGDHGPQPLENFGEVLPPTYMAPVQTYEPYDITTQIQMLSSELGDLLNCISLATTSEEDNKEKDVPPDDRTIFLTFSKGYPISENEVRDFYTRKFGDVIESICMQEVQPDEQVLYARLVVHSASIIDVVLEGQSKAKFSINGKHVWARKYVKKNPKSPQRATTSMVAVSKP